MKKVIIFISLITSIFILNNKVYAYKSYKIGDKVTYNEIDFYVIKDSSEDEDYVVLLKAEALTKKEIKYLNINEIYISDKGNVKFGNSNDYNTSDAKKVVDAWVNKNFKIGDFKSQRLITLNELIDNFGFRLDENNPTDTVYAKDSLNFDFILIDEAYFTMSKYNDSDLNIWFVTNYRLLRSLDVNHPGSNSNIRPVVELYKCAIDDACDNNDSDIINDNDDNKEIDDNKSDDKKKIEKSDINVNKNESKTKVNVPNTLRSVSGLIILIGMVLVCVGLNIFIIVKKRSHK